MNKLTVLRFAVLCLTAITTGQIAASLAPGIGSLYLVCSVTLIAVVLIRSNQDVMVAIYINALFNLAYFIVKLFS